MASDSLSSLVYSDIDKLKLFDEYVDKKLLIKAEDENLVQYNYTEYCNNNNLFDAITIFNRGCIYEKATGKLVARSMPKFFNFEQEPEEKQNILLLQKDFICTKKYDGCLGIIYNYNNKIRCNSRGSFDNFVTDAIKEMLEWYKLNCLTDYNLVVEVIHPNTRIVVNYNNEKTLRLITAYDTKQFNEVSFEDLKSISNQSGIPLVEAYNWGYDRLFNWQKENFSKEDLEEGFVLRYRDNYRIKIKSLQYMKIARAKASLSKKHVWSLWKQSLEQNNDLLNTFFYNLPDELMKEARQYETELQTELEEKRKEAEIEFNKFKELSNKELGLEIQKNKNKYSSYIFAKRNDKPTTLYLLKMIEPEV